MRFLVLVLLLTGLVAAQPQSTGPSYSVPGIGKTRLVSSISADGKLQLQIQGTARVKPIQQFEPGEWEKFQAAMQRAMKKAPKMAEGEWVTLWTQPGDRWNSIEVLAGKQDGMPICLVQSFAKYNKVDPPQVMIQERRFKALNQWLGKTAALNN